MVFWQSLCRAKIIQKQRKTLPNLLNSEKWQTNIDIGL